MRALDPNKVRALFVAYDAVGFRLFERAHPLTIDGRRCPARAEPPAGESAEHDRK